MESRHFSHNQLLLPGVTKGQGIPKIIPKNIRKEKEKLYEDMLHMKETLNNISDENTRLKVRNNQLEKENQKLSKIIEGVEKGQNVAYHQGSTLPKQEVRAFPCGFSLISFRVP